MPLQSINCIVCQKAFQPDQSRRLYCSRRCYHLGRCIPDSQCRFCQRPFHRRAPSHVFCSNVCAGRAKRGDDSQRFWEKVEKSDGCWIWLASLTDGGYGRFTARLAVDGSRRSINAHRFAFQDTYGPIPGDLHVCHKCDVNYPVGDISYRRCVRPDHLFLGTSLENNHDMIAKGRHPVGMQLSFAVLNDDIVRDIRRLREDEGLNGGAIAKRLNIKAPSVYGVLAGVSWRHVV